MRNNIYYLLDFHKKCIQIIGYGDFIINKYCEYVNLLLDDYLTDNEQKQLKLHNFNYDLIYKFAFGDVDDISFDGIDKNKLDDFFDKISFIDVEEFY